MPDGPRVPRPVAGVPPPALADGVALAKAWLLELLAAAPLAAAPGVPVGDLAAGAPALCAALADAVGDDGALARLAPGGDLATSARGAAALAGAHEPEAAAAATAALRRVLWAALSADVRRDDAAAAIALAERVAHVADVVTAAALGATAGAGARDLGGDLAGAEEPWLAALDRALERHRAGGEPVAVLAMEADDAERLLAVGGEQAAALDALEAAVRAAVGPGAAVVRERPGRLWAIAPGLDGDAGRALAMRVAEAASAAAAPAGAPLRAAIGVAACPADGTIAGVLAQCADERLFAARAAGDALA